MSIAPKKRTDSNAPLHQRIYQAVTPEKPKRHWVIAIPMALLGTNLEILLSIPLDPITYSGSTRSLIPA